MTPDGRLGKVLVADDDLRTMPTALVELAPGLAVSFPIDELQLVPTLGELHAEGEVLLIVGEGLASDRRLFRWRGGMWTLWTRTDRVTPASEDDCRQMTQVIEDSR